MTTQHWFWAAAGIAAGTAIFAGIADHRRLHRKRIDDYGWMPWRGIQVTAAFATIIVLMLALKVG